MSRRKKRQTSAASSQATWPSMPGTDTGPGGDAFLGQPMLDPLASAVRSALRRRGLPALLLGLIVAALVGGAVLRLSKPRFEAVALLRVIPNQPRLVFQATEPEGSFYETFRRTQASLVVSPAVLNGALSHPDVRAMPDVGDSADPVQWLAGELRVEPIRDSEVLRVSMVHTNADAAATLVNAVVDAYMELIVQSADHDRLAKIDLLEQERRTRADDLDGKRRTLRQLADQVGTLDSGALSERQRLALDRLGGLRRELTRIELESLAAKTRLGLLDAKYQAGPVTVPEPTLENDLRADSRVQFYEQSIGEMDYQIAELRTRIRSEGDPVLAQLARRRAVLTSALNERREELRPEIEQRHQQAAHDELARELALGKQQLDQLVEQERALRDVVEKEQRQTEHAGRTSLDINFLQDELKQLDQVYQQVNHRLDELRVESKAPARVAVMSRAEAPRTPYQRKRQQLGAGALGTVAFTGVLFVMLREAFLRPRIGSPHELAGAARLPVLGMLPKLPAGRSGLVVKLGRKTDSQRRAYEDAVDNLRAILLLNGEDAEGTAIAITSAGRGEGRTTLAMHLAASVVRSGKKVLLVDADLRKPSLHTACGVPLQQGLVQVLEQNLSARCAIQHTAISGLDLLSAGAACARPDTLLAGAKLAQVLAELKQKYALILVDTPPVLAVPDTLHVARLCETTVLSVLRDVSVPTLVQTAYERLERIGIEVEGVVFNASNEARWTTLSERQTERFAEAAGRACASSQPSAGWDESASLTVRDLVGLADSSHPTAPELKDSQPPASSL